MENSIKSVADETIISNMLNDVAESTTALGTASDNTAKEFDKFSDVYISDDFKARKRLNEDEYKRRRAKNKAAKRARRANR